MDKSDAMRTHEKWIEEVIKNKPKEKHPDVGELPIKMWHVFAALGAVVVFFVLIAILVRV